MVIFGIVEDRLDPLRLGRCRVRIAGKHNPDKSLLKTQDLPWAYPVQSITSAAISGVGDTPLGPVVGTWVKIEFYDEEEQIPVMTGTLGGIPQNSSRIDIDSDTINIVNEEGELPAETASQNVTGLIINPLTKPVPAKPAKQYTSLSSEGINLIKDQEKLKLKAYLDSNGIPTIGYGTTLINGNPVTIDMSITEDQANQYFTDHINNEVLRYIKSNVNTVITQSMCDALGSFVYNLGSGNFANSNLLTELNSGRYVECAVSFDNYVKDKSGKTLNGLVTRRGKEKVLFLKDGIPGSTGSDVIQPIDDINLKNESVLYGFGYSKDKYPLYTNEPDTNRLARHEQIDKTIIIKKEAARVKGVVTAGGFSWTQSPSPYNAQYPLNHVKQTESGHVVEFDDTPKSERIHIYHKSGTYSEIDANGTQVRRIVGDDYEILERDGYLYVKGNKNVTIDGVARVKVNNALNLDVSGVTTINVFNDVNLNVGGNLNTSVSGSYNIKAKSFNVETDNSINIKAGDKFAVDYVRGDFGNGASGSGLSNSTSKVSPVVRDQQKLTVITRGLVASQHYETPDEGDATIFIQNHIDKGLIDADEIAIAPVVVETIPVVPIKQILIPSGCDLINQIDKFDSTFQISKRFNLGILTKNGSRPVKPQFGLTVQTIVCNLKGLCENCIEPIFNMYPNAIITSAFRRPGDVKNSSTTSQHYLGQAVDIVLSGFNRQQHYDAIKKIQQSVPHDQLLLEYTSPDSVWIHISFKYTANRSMVFTMLNHRRASPDGSFTLLS